MVDFLQSSTKSNRALGVGAVFCKYTDIEIQGPENILASLCIQVLGEYVPMPETLVKLFKLYRSQVAEGTPNIVGHSRCILRSFESVDTLYLVVDALDERLDQTRSMVLRELRHWLSDYKILVTTRPIEDITQEFAAGSIVQIHAHDLSRRQYVYGTVAHPLAAESSCNTRDDRQPIN